MNPNQYPKGLSNVFPRQFFPEICIKSKNIVCLPFLFQKTGMI